MSPLSSYAAQSIIERRENSRGEAAVTAHRDRLTVAPAGRNLISVSKEPVTCPAIRQLFTRLCCLSPNEHFPFPSETDLTEPVRATHGAGPGKETLSSVPATQSRL